MELMSKPTWTADDLSQVIGLQVSTIRRKLSDRPGDLPPSARVGRSHIWLPARVLEWLAKKTDDPVSRQSPIHQDRNPAKRGRGRPRKVANVQGSAA